MHNVDSLRAAIAANVSASRRFRATIAAASGAERDGAWRAKRSLGAATRSLLLALALRRGVPYARVESPRTSRAPSPLHIALALEPDDAAARAARYGEALAWLGAPRADEPAGRAAA